jgi:hypothetical protein
MNTASDGAAPRPSGLRAKHQVVRIARPLALIAVLLCVVTSAALGDVDMSGHIRRSLSRLASPLSTAASGTYECDDGYSVVGNTVSGFAIGNCAAEEKIEVVSYSGEDPKSHQHAYGGWLPGEYHGCGWIDTPEFAFVKVSTAEHKKCYLGGGNGTVYEEHEFAEEVNNESIEDGYYVANPRPCKEYANFRPWEKKAASSASSFAKYRHMKSKTRK